MGMVIKLGGVNSIFRGGAPAHPGQGHIPTQQWGRDNSAEKSIRFKKPGCVGGEYSKRTPY